MVAREDWPHFLGLLQSTYTLNFVAHGGKVLLNIRLIDDKNL